MIKSVKKITLYIAISTLLFPVSLKADPNTALEDVSPTHFQLFQLTQLQPQHVDAAHPQTYLGPLINSSEEIAEPFKTFNKECFKAYTAFLKTYHTHKDQQQNYADSALMLLDRVPDFSIPNDSNSLDFCLASEPDRELILTIIAQEVKAAAEGQCLYWRFEFDDRIRDPLATHPKSFSAPGILSGLLYDGLDCFRSAARGSISHGACTYIYSANIAYARSFDTAESYVAFRQEIEDMIEALYVETNTPLAEIPHINLPEPDPTFTFDENDKERRSQWLSDVQTHAIKKLLPIILKGHNTTKINSKIMTQSLTMGLEKKHKTGTLYALKIPGTYHDNEISRACPHALSQFLGLFGRGEFFHPKVNEEKISTYEKITLARYRNSS